MIEGAIGGLTLSQNEVGKSISVQVSYVDERGFQEVITSEETVPIVNINSSPEGLVYIEGLAEEGQTLDGNLSYLSDKDGLGTLNYQWLADGQTIAGANNQSFTLTQNEVGKVITLHISYLDVYGEVETITSHPTSLVQNVNDAPAGTITIDGLAQEDQTLFVNTTH